MPEKKDRKADQNPKTNLFFAAAITRQTKKEKKAQTQFLLHSSKMLEIKAKTKKKEELEG